MYGVWTWRRRARRQASEPRSAARTATLPSFADAIASFAIASMRAMRACCAARYVASQPRSYVHGSGHGRQPFAGSYMSSSGTTDRGSFSSATDGSITCPMNTPSPGCAATPTHASPQPPCACASAISEPPPLLPNSTTASAPRRRISATAVSTSVTQFSCRQSVSLFR